MRKSHPTTVPSLFGRAVAYIGYLALMPVGYGYSGTRKPMLARSVAAEPLSEEGSERRSVEERARAASEIPPAANEILMDVYSFNLDSDLEDEQVLAVRRTDDPSGLLRLVVADYLPASRAWVRAWEGSTAVTKVQTLQVLVKDVVGDHIPNIISVGMNERGEQAVSIFWRTPPPVKTAPPSFTRRSARFPGIPSPSRRPSGRRATSLARRTPRPGR